MRKSKRRSYRKIGKLLMIQIILITAILVLGKSFYTSAQHGDTEHRYPTIVPESPDAFDEVSVNPSAKAAINSELPAELVSGKLVSENAILISIDDQRVLYDKNSQETIYPASLTKIMTAIIAIENLKDLNQNVVLSSEMFDRLYQEDASMAGFLPGEEVPAIDLLYGVLLPSGAECCIGLAEYISGSEEAFVSLMNEKAEELQMEHTHFTNVTGLHSKDHYTTATDLAILLEYCLQNNTFKDIFTTKRYSTQATALHPDGITFSSTLFKNLESPDFPGGCILGGKTGYTSEAGLCLASLAEKNGREYILVTAGAKGDHTTEQYNITDALYVYNHMN